MISENQILNAKILIADHQKLHSLFLEKTLTQEGYRDIKCELDSLKVLSVSQDYKPDIIILDLAMPQIDGFQILEQLNEFRREHYLPILTLSADKNSDVRIRALQSGATDFLVKPYENIELLFRIRNMIIMRILNLEVENQNKILEEKVRVRTKELRETQLDIIRRLAQAAEFRDNDTGQHIIRMSKYCAKLGEAMGLDDDTCELMLNASPLHDVGKIGIPDRILLKPGKLTVEEYEIMKTHTIIGAQLLSKNNSPVMKMAQQIALTHHEKWDGTGYPRQIKGEEIPSVGQIASVCDVFDALTSIRPYKEAWTTEKAIKEIQQMREKNFEPNVVDRFIAILPEIQAIKEKYAG